MGGTTNHAYATKAGWGGSSLSYDSACHDLAQLFLEAEDAKVNTPHNVEDLATRIQNAIEDWFFQWEHEQHQREESLHVVAKQGGRSRK